MKDLETGTLHDVAVRRKVVRARYLEGEVPATHTPSSEISPGARVVPVKRPRGGRRLDVEEPDARVDRRLAGPSTKEDDALPPNPYASRPEDWPRMISRTWWRTEYGAARARRVAVGGREPAQLLRDLPHHAGEPEVQESLERHLTNVGPAIERLRRLG